MNAASDGLSERQRRIRFRAWHRGTREMDLVLGRFVDSEIANLNSEELDMLEALMEAPDPTLYLWIAGTADVPANFDTPLFHKLVAFHSGGTGAGN